MTSKQQKLEQASAQVGERVALTRKPRPQRKAFAALASPPSSEAAIEPPSLDEQPVPTETPAASPSTPVVAEPAPDSTQDGPPLPDWRDVCEPPARKGTAGRQRRFNVPVPYQLMQRLNELDAAQTRARANRINRNLLVQAAAQAYAQDQRYWVMEWESSAALPATTSLQARVPDATLDAINGLRYLDDEAGVRSVNPGPILALIVGRILAAD